jgi:hypothetical protein
MKSLSKDHLISGISNKSIKILIKELAEIPIKEEIKK